MRSSTLGRSLRLDPYLVIFAVVFAMNLLVLPVGIFVDPLGFAGVSRGLTDTELATAYIWTIYACAALGFLYYVLGIARMVKAYQERPLEEFKGLGYEFAWLVSFSLGLVCVFVMYIQAGFRIPVLLAYGADYWTYNRYRTEFTELINQNLYMITLYWFTTFSVVVGFIHVRRFKIAIRAFSIALVLLVGLFTLARSTLSLALVIVVIYRLFTAKLRVYEFVTGISAAAILMVGMHQLAGDPGGYDSMSSYLGSRLLYGQWMALPHFFALFNNEPAALSTILPPILQAGPAQITADSPARLVMWHLAPEAAADGTAGVACGFFIGEAFAIAGIAGVVLAPLLVVAQMWLISKCFESLRKTPLTVCLYAWFLFKIMLGIISGVSAFLFTALQVMILIVAYWVFMEKSFGNRSRTLARNE